MKNEWNLWVLLNLIKAGSRALNFALHMVGWCDIGNRGQAQSLLWPPRRFLPTRAL